MPIIKSAVKRMRQTAKRSARNTATKRTLRTEVKLLTTAIAAKDVKTAASQLQKVQSKLDISVKKNILKKNTAARKLSNLTAQVKALGAKPAAAAKKPASKTAAKPVAKIPSKKPATKKAATKKPSTTKAKSSTVKK